MSIATGRWIPCSSHLALLSRSKAITYDNLRRRDREFAAKVDEWFSRDSAGRVNGSERPFTVLPPMFGEFELRDMRLANRVVVSPMCQYSANEGVPDDWHFVHLTSRAMGGAGMVFTEMACVSPEARITPGCAGLWNATQLAEWKRIVDFVHAQTNSRIAVQIGHAGRKGATKLAWDGIDQPLEQGDWEILSASSIPYFPNSKVPREMTRADMVRITDDFVCATRLAAQAGFDHLELHGAHGYLLASFLSPVTNQRGDVYGGSVNNRLRYPLEVFEACRAVWPQNRPMSVRISACDWMEGGLTAEDAVLISRAFHEQGCDLINVSTGQTDPEEKPVYGRMFQTPFSEQIRLEAGVPTVVAGNIFTWDQVNTIVGSGRADLVALARTHLYNPYFTRHAAAYYGIEDLIWPKQYLAGQFAAFRQFERERHEVEELREQVRPRSDEETSAALHKKGIDWEMRSMRVGVAAGVPDRTP